MRKAVDARKGPLTDAHIPVAEREALAHLAAGAIGSYKNPHSHRTVTLNDPTDAAEMIILASHVLRARGELACGLRSRILAGLPRLTLPYIGLHKPAIVDQCGVSATMSGCRLLVSRELVPARARA